MWYSQDAYCTWQSSDVLVPRISWLKCFVGGGEMAKRYRVEPFGEFIKKCVGQGTFKCVSLGTRATLSCGADLEC